MYSLLKNANRLIRKTRGRFLSLTAIVGLGTAFFIGVSAISSIMAASVDRYDDRTNLKDITIYSNYGFDADDIAAVNRMNSVELAEGSKFADVVTTVDSRTMYARVHSYTDDMQINQFVLRSGRLPENNHEALTEVGSTIVPGYPIGSVVELSRPDQDLDDYLSVDKVTIVGMIDTPLYLSATREAGTLANQEIETFLYVPEAAFTQDFYTELNILIKDGKNYDSFSQEYQDYAAHVKEELSILAETQADERRQKIVDDAMDQYNDGVAKYEDGLKEYNDGQAEYQKGLSTYYREIAKAQKTLRDAEQEISDGWTQIFDGEAKLNAAQAELDQARIEYGNQIADGKRQLEEGRRQLEQGKQEFAEKEKEYLAIRAQLTEALEQLNAPMLDRTAKLSFFMKDLCEEAQCLIRGLLCYIGLDPVNATVGDVSDYLNSNFNDATIAAMNARIDEVLKSEDYIEIIREDEEVEFDPEELVKLLKEQELSEPEEMDTEEVTLLNHADSEDSETEDPEPESELDTDAEAASEPAGTQPETVPEATEPAAVPPVSAEPSAPDPQEPAPEMLQPEGASETAVEPDPEPMPEPVIEEPQSEEPMIEEPAGEEPAPAEEVLLVNQAAVLEDDSGILAISTETDSEPHETGRVREVHHSITCFNELIKAMGDSDPTFSQLMKFTVWPYMSVDAGISILNTKARVLQDAGGILETVLSNGLPDELTIGTVAYYNADILKLRDQFHLTDDNTLGEVRALLVSNIGQIDQGLNEGRAKIAEGEATLNAMAQQLADGEAELNQKLADGQAQIDAGWAEIAENRQKLLDARVQLNQGYFELNRQKAEGWSELVKAKNELDSGWQELEDARVELEDAKQEIDSLEEAEWIVLDRSQHYATATYRNTIQQMQAIARIFPLFFIAVAALVCLTTMTRMVNEERGQIGIFRALGFNKFQCSFAYLYYAGLASVIGSMFGAGIGLATFPRIIYSAWRMLYILPKMKMDIPWATMIGSLVVFFLMMEGVTIYVLSSDMKEVPASVMRPKAPKLGKDILLEKISLIWDHLSFSWKVTVRNLMRYKRRMAMTVAGVAGCSALLVTGFGISDSINDILRIQFYEVDRTQAAISLNNDGTDKKRHDEIVKELLSINGIKAVYSNLSYTGKVMNQNGLDEVAYTQIFDDAAEAADVYNIRERISGEPLTLQTGSVIITEKLSENLGLGIGDSITIESKDGRSREVPISGIMEMYAFHYVLMDTETYSGLFGAVPNDNSLSLELDDTVKLPDDFAARVTGVDGVDSLTLNDTVMEDFNQMITGINGVVAVLIISSMILAFVVLGNLTNVNISERLREIATLKVLGFREKEVQNYIYKENNILVAAGAIAGLPVGMVLHRYIMREVELTNIMFGRSESMRTFVYAFLLTVLFGLLVNFFMRRKLNRIMMVESLKSVE